MAEVFGEHWYLWIIPLIIFVSVFNKLFEAQKTKKAKAVLFLVCGCLGGVFLSYVNSPDTTQYPSSNATYSEVNRAVGCDSSYSEDKKDAIFRTEYKDHWMTWRGVIQLVSAGDVSLNLDGQGTQDLQVSFANDRTGYNLQKGQRITVKFLMRRTGGCFLPFTGTRATIIRQ